jgi:mono/diheme cytochrome c family protein
MGTQLFYATACLVSVLLGWSAATARSTDVTRRTSYAEAQDRKAPEDYNSGAYLYRTFCASCHGATGKGDGPVADLSTPRPPDLTVLQRDAGGLFPRARVAAALEDSSKLAGHRSAAMPDWKQVLRRTEGARAQEHLNALVAHIEALQVKN